MWRVILIVAVSLVCLFPVTAQILNEAETSLILNEKTADLSLVIENPRKAADVPVTVELLDAEDNVRANLTRTLPLKTGKEIYKLSLPLGDLLETNRTDIAWFRLRYRIGDTRGIVSLSRIVRDIFEIRVIAAEDLLTGMTYRLRIRTSNPFNNQVTAGVKLNAETVLELKDDRHLSLTAAGETDENGFADLEFRIPVEAEFSGEGEIKITGKKNGVIREATEDLQTITDDYQFPMLADKPIYQPEQMLNVRGILLKGGEEKTVVANTEVEFRILDEEDTVLYREKVKTSAFGIAAVSWEIPENAKLGRYQIRVQNAEEKYLGYQSVKVSRYDLPNFAVSAKALKTYYLPDENQAEVEVSADYLFGKPVTNGKVRVVREDERTWNYKQQKYDIKEGESHDGKTDENGRFTAKFDLKKDHEKLDDESKFRDLNFTAYFTDLTTNRTEQRRFDIRITREPIHVYFIGERENNHAALPINAYVSAFYADGSPCLCDIELKGRNDDDSEDAKYKTILKTKTNSLGGGKIRFLSPKFEDSDDDLDFEIIAKDKKGLKGTYGGKDEWRARIEFEDEDALRIETDKTVFKPGEPVKVKINAAFETETEPYSPRVYVDVVKDRSVIESYFVDLKNNRGELKIPYQPKFQGELKIAAYYQQNNEFDGDFVGNSRGIIFPHSENLRLETSFDKETYKPAEEAKVSFSVLDSLGQAVNSALGVVVFDRAVEERARTEGEFNGTFRSYYGWLGYGKSFGSVNIKDLNELDLTKPISDEMQLAAEIILYDEKYLPNVFTSDDVSATQARSYYAKYFRNQFDAVEKKLADHYKLRSSEHPTDEASFNRILHENGVSFEDLRDPWGLNYKAVFAVERANDVVRIISAGTDKKFGTDDDFTVSSANFLYFAPTADLLNNTIKDFHSRTGDYIRDEKTLLRELGMTEIKDRFARPYRIGFYIEGRNIVLRIMSSGPNGKTGADDYDDFEVYSNYQNYFAETEEKIRGIFAKAPKTPLNESEFKTLLKQNGVDLDQTRDGWGEKVYLVKKEFTRYENVYKEEVVSEYGKEETTKRRVITPVTRGYISYQIRSKGADKKENTADDATLAEFQKVVWEQTKDDPKPVYKTASFVSAAGSINGTVTDAAGAAVPGATVTATENESAQSRSTLTDENGKYFIGNLTAGKYSVKAELRGFNNAVRSNVPVTANSITKVDFSLQVGTVSEVVEISALPLNERSATGFALTLSTVRRGVVNGARSDQSNITLDGVDVNDPSKNKSGSGNNTEKSTPKLREYFPETLVWSPELLTDNNGRAALTFKMADNITTWKLYTIASTKNGKFGVSEKEVTAFQPFFVDLDPPKFLTAGDEIYLPTQVRNYTTAKQKVDVTMSKSDWFSLLGPDLQKIEVDRNSSQNAVFGFRADALVKDGKQKVTAVAAKDSDAIEKPVTVRPNGEEIVRTDARLISDSARFDVDFPANTLPKTPKAELKIYPNLMAHVTESVEGLLQRPYGCGEQTISSTYPNLMILKFVKTDNSLTKKAKKNLRTGYERLLGYQIADGGFSYWGGKDSSDIALTAYALRFLNDAKPFVAIDEKVIENARKYLIGQQRADGSFYKKYYSEEKEDQNRAKMLTTYVARTLAKLNAEVRTSARTNESNTDTLTTSNDSALPKALNYLKTRNAEIDKPYSLALYALANFDAGNAEEAEKTVAKLQTLAKGEGNLAYWNLETNTPFYGWGTVGRIETTALVVQALLKAEGRGSRAERKELIGRGMMFLLNNKDRYGVWYSTQTTINVLDTFLATLGEVKEQTISVAVNGERLRDFAVAADRIEPLVVPLSEKLAQTNRLEIKSSADAPVMAQLVKTHYIDWKDSLSTNRSVNDSRAIRLDYKCDKLNPKIMETVTCSVAAERSGFQGYGMLLAEIGIPPGADVSRESLEKAFANDWSLSRYDVLPDRIVVYMWAKAGGSRFDFSFRPRYAINAQTPMSIVYDYYNEESRGVVAPVRFEVR